MDTMYLRIERVLRHMGNLSGTFTQTELTEYFNRFLYPVSVIPFHTLRQNPLFESKSGKEIINYLSNFCNFLFQNYYTPMEKRVICLYGLCKARQTVLFQPEESGIINSIEEILTYSFEKEEIRYLCADLKERLVEYYINSDNINKNYLIDRYLNDLQQIEDWYNHFNFHALAI